LTRRGIGRGSRKNCRVQIAEGRMEDGGLKKRKEKKG